MAWIVIREVSELELNVVLSVLLFLLAPEELFLDTMIPKTESLSCKT